MFCFTLSYTGLRFNNHINAAAAAKPNGSIDVCPLARLEKIMKQQYNKKVKIPVYTGYTLLQIDYQEEKNKWQKNSSRQNQSVFWTL